MPSYKLLRPGKRGRTKAIEAPAVIPDSTPPIFVFPEKGVPQFKVPKQIRVRIGSADPKDTVAMRTVTLTPAQARDLGAYLVSAAIRLAPSRRRRSPASND